MIRHAIFLLAGALCSHALRAESGPQPPCGSAPYPAYPEVQGAPVVKIWERSDWTPPGCTGWSASASATLVVTVARFRYNGGIGGLRRRIGAVSEMRGWLYWSTSHQKWQPFLLEAYAVTGRDGDQRRKDFAPDEIAAGRQVSIHQEDELLGKVTYRMRIVSATADRLVFATENSSTAGPFGLPLFQAGAVQAICFLDREAKDVWRYYQIGRLPKEAALLTMGHDASLINRAVALYRYLAGIPADQEPPAAR